MPRTYRLRAMTAGILLGCLFVFSACSGEDQAVELSEAPRAKTQETAATAESKPQSAATYHSPTVKVKPVTEVTAEEWQGIIDAIISTQTKELMSNQVYVIVNDNGVFPFWENNGRLISLGFPHGESLAQNPFLLKYLKEFPSSLQENDFSLLDKSSYSAEEKRQFRLYREKIETILPMVLSENVSEFKFTKVEAHESPGKFMAHYIKGDEEYVMNIYDILIYENGSYDDINPEEIFGTERIILAQQGYIYRDEFSLTWRNGHHMFEIDVEEGDEPLAEITPLVTAYLEKFPSEKF